MMRFRAMSLLPLLAIFGLVASASLRTSSQGQLKETETEADRYEAADREAAEDTDRSGAEVQMPAAAIKRVISMLENLVAEMDAEAEQDEKQFAEFSKWCGTQQAATAAAIEALNTKIEELKAALAKLYSQRSELETVINRLQGEIDTTKSQIAQATEKRNEEHSSFVAEQSDFDNSIAACNKAVDILAKHYGDGDTGPAEKPSWMGLIQVANTVKKAVQRAKVDVSSEVLSFLQAPSHERYQSKAGEAGNIVDQMKMLADTFAEDKQSAMDEEARLQKLYDTLMKEKTELLNSLIKERDERQQVLNAVNQDIGEKESAKASSEAELKDEQAYLGQTKKLCDDTAMLFEQRKKDRAEEKLATQEAIKVLEGDAGESFVQSLIQEDNRHHNRHRHKLRHHGRGRCPSCRKAASLLSQAANQLRSGMLATAAAATMGTDAVMDVISALEGLITRLDEDQQMEKEHKEWCESEISTTQEKQQHHEAMVEELTGKISDEAEVIEEKKVAIQHTIDGIARADKNFNEATTLRQKEKEEFEVEQQNYMDALAALNQAMDILSKFYAKKASFAQEQDDDSDNAPPSASVQPGIFDNVYEQKGGKGVVMMIAQVRKEYEQGKADLEAAETKAADDYIKYKADYQAMRRDLVSQKDKLTIEQQTAEQSLAQFKEDKAANEQEVQAAKTYLAQLAQSCNSLLEHYDDRVKLRKEEKAAINEAINVLKNET